MMKLIPYHAGVLDYYGLSIHGHGKGGEFTKDHASKEK
jgi:hypothetical protein